MKNNNQVTDNHVFGFIFLWACLAGLLVGFLVYSYFVQNPIPNSPLGPIGLGGTAWAAIWFIGGMIGFTITS